MILKNIPDLNMKQKFTKLLNQIFASVYGITHRLFQVQELNNIYEQIDDRNNKRYVVDATLNAVSNYYTARVILDIVVIDGEVMINYISINNASNNNIIDAIKSLISDVRICIFSLLSKSPSLIPSPQCPPNTIFEYIGSLASVIAAL